MKPTIKQQIRNDIDILIKTEKLITWAILGITPYPDNCNYTSYEGKVVFDYMKELNIAYVCYTNISSDKRMHGNTKVFYNDISERRKRKIQQINKSIQNNK
ncbi:hypothetical protein [Lentimicrobium sp. S6]|uniref:hypothetical protein n=1 Tax=Lentimicrobium sp. S6 TaxID=2735872 RepID=UPI001554F1FD|nr:hypothetical protein [Lentimicrobium sp. S6]NPD44657.1 hypothetical protein [Lentimicrobium sp. S6]